MSAAHRGDATENSSPTAVRMEQTRRILIREYNSVFFPGAMKIL
jgi:hypothetical protein